MAFITRDQTFFDQPASAWLGQSTNTVSIPNIINMVTINGGDITGGIVTPASVNTLSNKSLIADSTYIIDTLDPTKRIAFNASAVSSGSTVLFDMVGSGTIVFPNPAGGTATLIDSASDTTITGNWSFTKPMTAVFGQVQLYISAATSFTPDGATDYSFGIGVGGSPSIVPPNGIFIPATFPSRFVSWSAINNIPGMISQGTFNWKYRPNYTGVPAASTRIITQQNGGRTCNIWLTHQTTGNLDFVMSNATADFVISGTFFIWNGGSVPSCVLGTEYDFELSYDITVSIARLFINGTLVGTLNGAPFTRNIAGSDLYVGPADDLPAGGAGNFYIREIYATIGVLHTAGGFVPAPPNVASMNVGSLKVTDVMSSTSPTTGALTVAGGIGTSGTLNSKQVSVWSPDQATGHFDINVADTTGNTTFSRSAGTTRDFIFTGDATTGSVTIQSAEPQTGSSGALVVAGGIYSGSRVGCAGMVIGDPALFDPLFSATYSTSINAETAFNPIGSPFGGATIVNGKLDLTGGGARYVTYVAGNGAFQQTGAIHLFYTPTYTGTPTTLQYIVDFSLGGTDINHLTFFHNSPDGRIYCHVGSYDLLNNAAYGTTLPWAPVAGVEYELEVDLDLTAGNVHIFVNGTRLGSSITTQLVHDHSGYVMSVGRSPLLGTPVTQFRIRDLTVFSRVLHTASYTPYVPINAITTTSPISASNITARTVICSGSLITMGPVSLGNVRDVSFGATFSSSFDAEIAFNRRSATIGTPSIDGGKAVIQPGDGIYFAAGASAGTSFDALATKGTLRFRLTPNYNGIPPVGQLYLSAGVSSGLTTRNRISLVHLPGSGAFELLSYDAVGEDFVFVGVNGTTFVLGQEYEIEVDFDFGAGGISRIFIDGIMIASNGTTCARTTEIDRVAFGVGHTLGLSDSDFSIRDFVLMTSVIHSTDASYTPGYTLTSATSGIIQSGGLSCSSSPINPYDVIRLSEFIAVGPLVLSASGPCDPTPVTVKFMKIGLFVTFIVEATFNTFTANGSGGELIIETVPAQYIPSQALATAVEYYNGLTAGYVMGHMSINTSTINMLPITGSFTAINDETFGPIKYCTFSYFI